MLFIYKGPSEERDAPELDVTFSERQTVNVSESERERICATVLSTSLFGVGSRSDTTSWTATKMGFLLTFRI